MPELSLRFKSRELSRIPITEMTTTIGRDPDCDVQIDNLGVSRIHATVLVQNGQCVVQDNGSQNGTFLDGRRVGFAPLTDGAEIQIGKHVVCFHAMTGPALPGSQVPPPQRGRPKKTLLGVGQFAVAPTPEKKKPKGFVQTMHMSGDQVARAMASGQMPAPQESTRPPSLAPDAVAPKLSRAPLFVALGCAFVFAAGALALIAWWAVS